MTSKSTRSLLLAGGVILWGMVPALIGCAWIPWQTATDSTLFPSYSALFTLIHWSAPWIDTVSGVLDYELLLDATHQPGLFYFCPLWLLHGVLNIGFWAAVVFIFRSFWKRSRRSSA